MGPTRGAKPNRFVAWLLGSVGAIAAAVLTAWSLHLFGPKSRPVDPGIGDQTPPVTSPEPAGIGACGSGDAPSNTFHDAAAPNGSWDWNCDGQVEREWSPCENLAPAQCQPHTNATGAPPGFCSEIRSEGGCVPKIAECGQEGWTYPCFYNPADGRCHAGGYERATVMRCR